MKLYNREEKIDPGDDCFKAYPPVTNRRHTFGKYTFYDADVWIDLTEFRRAKGFESVPAYVLVNGELQFDKWMSKRHLSKLGVCG